MHVYADMYKYLDRAVGKQKSIEVGYVSYYNIIYEKKNHVQFDDSHTLKFEQLMI